jgi:hypothetical protein
VASTPMHHRVRSRVVPVILAIAITAGALAGCEPKRCSGSPRPGTTSVSEGTGSTSALKAAPAARPKPKPKPKPKNQKPCPPKQRKTEAKKKMLGENGVRITSKTLYQGRVPGYRYRIDVENPAPGQRPGSLHVQLGGRGSTHYEYDAESKAFKSRGGARLPRRVQDGIDDDTEAQRMIRYGLRLLGER